MKKKLCFFSFFLFIALIFLSGCKHDKGTQGTQEQKKTPDQQSGDKGVPDVKIPEDVPNEVGVSAIKVALVKEGPTIDTFEDVKNFRSGKSGPFEAPKEAETAYVDIKVETEFEKPETFKVFVENINTFEEKIELQIGKGNDAKSFVIPENSRKIVLSKGKNYLDVKVVAKDKTEGIYRIAVEYAGGPDYTELPIAEEPTSVISGIYCPAQRKPTNKDEDGERLFFVMIQGNCGYCGKPIAEIGGKKGTSQRFKSKGVRVIAMKYLQHPKEEAKDSALALQKWKNSKFGYNMYIGDPYNCFFKYIQIANQAQRGTPNYFCIGEDGTIKFEGLEITDGRCTTHIRQIFGL